MTIDEFLQQENARILFGNSWMYYSDDGDWIVLKHCSGKKHNDTLYIGKNSNEAIMALKHSED